MKVMKDGGCFDNEVKIHEVLNAISLWDIPLSIFKGREKTYYLGNFNMSTLRLSSSSKDLVKKKKNADSNSNSNSQRGWWNPLVTEQLDGGVIVMKHAVHTAKPINPGEMYNSLAYLHHRNILHCDLRRSNMAYFGEEIGWKIIDFDLAVIKRRDATYVDTFIQRGSNQHICCGENIKTIIDNEANDGKCVQWKAADDYAMLAKNIFN